jgi:Uma2 family endonuclease
VAWGSQDFARTYGEVTPYPRAPEICVEVVPPSNTDDEIKEKTRAYLAAGAIEVWIVAEDGSIRIHSAAGEVTASVYPVKLQLPGPIAPV